VIGHVIDWLWNVDHCRPENIHLKSKWRKKI